MKNRILTDIAGLGIMIALAGMVIVMRYIIWLH